MAMPRRAAAARVVASGGRVRRGLTRRTAVVVVGHGAHSLLANGVFDRRLTEARRLNAVVLSEHDFLRAIGDLGPLPSVERDIPAEALAQQAAIDPAVLDRLVLFDVVEPVAGRFGFRDLVAVRDVARLLEDGASLAEVVESTATLRRRDPQRHLSQVRLARSRDDGIVLKIGDRAADLDGQMQLPMPLADRNPSVDEIFEAAEIAEQEGDLAAAEAGYRRCLDLERDDPTTAFNLANVLRDQGRLREARLYFQHAIAADPDYVEAHYNLADVHDKEGHRDLAKAELRRAVALDDRYADAIFNLAQLEFRDGNYEAATTGYERYLALDDSSEWAKIARHTLALLRQQAMQGV
jgi:tetratricopeptide (TPR) repeat protein